MKYSETIISKRLRILKMTGMFFHASVNSVDWLYKITL